MDDTVSADNQPADGLGILAALLRAAGRVQTQLNSLARDADLNVTELLVLQHCASSSGVAQRDLAAAIALSPAQVSSLVERLRSRGLIHGQRPSQDRRRQVWRLTDQGRGILQQLEPALSSATSQLLTSQEPRDLGFLLQLLEQLNDCPHSAEPPCRNDMRGAA